MLHKLGCDSDHMNKFVRMRFDFFRHGHHKCRNLFGFFSEILSTEICLGQPDSILSRQSSQSPGSGFDIHAVRFYDNMFRVF